MNIDIDEELKNINFDFHKKYNKIYLTDYQYNILKQYGFNVYKFRDLKELILAVDNYLNEIELPDSDLEGVLDELAEFDYYNNTNK